MRIGVLCIDKIDDSVVVGVYPQVTRSEIASALNPYINASKRMYRGEIPILSRTERRRTFSVNGIWMIICISGWIGKNVYREC